MNLAKSRAVCLCAFLLVIIIFSQITLGAVKDSLKTTAEQEWERWGRGARQESEPQMKPIVASYFAAGGCPGSDPTTVPWSAAFISYVMKTAGVTDFPGRCAHTQYFKAVHDNPGTCRTFPMGERGKIGVGEVVCRCRVSEEERAAGKTECNVDYDNAFGYSHCDIVVNVLGSGKVEVIGGNVNNNVEKRTLDVSRDESPEKKWYGFISCDGDVSDVTNVPISGSAQVQVGTVGVNPVEVYDGCSGKRIGLVGASNTWDTNPDGSPLPSNSWRNVNIIQDFCPGSTVFLNAKGGANPEVQLSLVKQVLTNDNLDYVIIDPSANGQPEYGFTAERYKAAVIQLAQAVKDKNGNIKVIILANTPLKDAADGYGTPETVQKVKAFNADLLNNKLGRPDLIDYAVDTYSAVEDPQGSDSCGKYCPNDHLHFGPAGRKQVMKAVMDTVFGAPAVAATVTSTTNSPSSGAENCLNQKRCDEIDAVWLKIVIWINNARKGQVFDAVKAWKPFQDTRPSTVINPTNTQEKVPAATKSVSTNFCVAAYGTNEQKALLDTIAWAEGTREKYNMMFSGKLFNSYASHPVETNEMPPGGISAGSYTSTAAGRYQFLYATFKGLRTQGYFATGFNSQEQDKAALDGLVIKKRGLSEEVLKSAVAAGNYELVWDKLAPEWASLPSSEKGGKSYYGQPVQKSSDLTDVYQNCLQYYNTGGLSAVASSVASSVSNAVSSITSIFGGDCPSEMANIDDKYCIDKWENSIYDKNNP